MINRLPESRGELPRGSKPHPKHGNLAASPDGRLWQQTRTGRWKEFLKEVLWLDKKAARILSAVLQCFMPKPGPKYKVGFRDGNRNNKSAKNLVWLPTGHSDDLRNAVRDRVGRGERRRDVAEQLEVPYSTVCVWTRNMPATCCPIDSTTD